MCREFVVSHTNEQIAQQFSLPQTPDIAASYSVRCGREIATIHETRNATSSTRSVIVRAWRAKPVHPTSKTIRENPCCRVPLYGLSRWSSWVKQSLGALAAFKFRLA